MAMTKQQSFTTKLYKKLHTFSTKYNFHNIKLADNKDETSDKNDNGIK